MNLNNSPPGGPLRSDELIPWRRTGSNAGVQPEPDLGMCGNVGSEGDPRNAQPLHAYIAELLAVPPGIVIALALVGGIVAVVGLAHFALT